MAYEGIVPHRPASNLQQNIFLPIQKWKHNIENDFEDSVFRKFPEVKKIKEKLYSLGAVYASMSGSGSAVFGVFEKRKSIAKNFTNCFVWEEQV